jgi:hypothetical protein
MKQLEVAKSDRRETAVSSGSLHQLRMQRSRHQTIVNAAASCRRAGGDKGLDRCVGRLCHRRNFSQSLFSVAISLVVSCIV